MPHLPLPAHRSRAPSGRSLVARAFAALAVLWLVALVAPAHARDIEPLAAIGPAQRGLALPLDEALKSDLRRRDWASALRRLEAVDLDTLVGAEKSDWAFLRAWAMVRVGKGAEAAGLLPLIEGGRAPRTYVDLVRGEIAMAREDRLEALEHLAAIPETSVIHPRAAIQRAEVLRELGRTQEAFAIYEELAQREDPADGNAKVLLALARRHGAGSEKARPYVLRLWSAYPGTPEEAEARRMLSAWSTPPGWQEQARRAEQLMWAGDFKGAIALADAVLAQDRGATVDACRALFVRGRSYYRLNQLTNSVNGFGDAGRRCVEVEGDYGPRALYLVGTAEMRRGRHQASAAAYRLLTDLYPEHSMADDGLTRGGIALQEAGDLAGAQAMWREALERFPEGDTGPEAIWRLAFSLYLEGKPDEARRVAERLGALPLGTDAVHVAAGRYWAARWALYPDVEAPTRPVEDPAARQTAIDGFADVVQTWPHSFYSILAWSRLQELAPERAEQLARRTPAHATGDLDRPWVVRLSFLEDPSVADGAALARIGLIREAMDEWSRIDRDELTPDEMAWLTELRIEAGDWLYAHDAMRRWLFARPVGTLGPRQPQVVRVAYPDRYWDLVQQAAADDRYEPRLFHALVREESNFNRTIVSFAGARGLSQLMPATAQQTAGWLGMRISNADLDDPKTNLTIGARYFDAMHKQFGDSPYLSLAAYNAGAGRVNQWLGRWGNVPTDEFVERIPFRETRDYVKRVMGTWQTMRWQFDVEAPAFYDLSAFNHQAKRESR